MCEIKNCKMLVEKNYIYIWDSKNQEGYYISFFGKKEIYKDKNSDGLLLEGKNVHIGKSLKELICPKTELLD